MPEPAITVDFVSDALEALSAYLEIPCLSPAYDADWESTGHLERAVTYLADWSRGRPIRGLSVDVHRLKGRTPILVCEVAASDPHSTGTVLLYGHFDKQPPLGTWSEGLDPFRPVLRGTRLYGRGGADDGYSIFSALLAIEAVQRAGLDHRRCVILIEGSEESASPDLDAHVDTLSDRLGDVELLICLDSGSPTYDRLWLTQSLRGNVTVTVEVDVLERGVHSGAASGVVPSSFRLLRRLIERVEDSTTGDVLVPELHAEAPSLHRARYEALAAEFGDLVGEAMPSVEGLELAGASASERLLRQAWAPAMSVVGIDGIPSVASGGNVLRPMTAVNLSFRLPPAVDGEAAARALARVLQADPPSGSRVSVRFHSPASGWICPELPQWLSEAVDDASSAAFGRPAAWTSEGGTIPFLAGLGRRFPGIAVLATGVLGPGSNAHGIDECLDLPTANNVTLAVANILASHGATRGATQAVQASEATSP